MTQYELVKNHLEKHGTITSWQAIQKYGITRLSQYIYVMRKQGFYIIDVWESKINRYGDKVYFKKYILKDMA